MEWAVEFALSVLLLLLLLIWYNWNWWNNLPSGPVGLPFVGYAPFLGNFPHVKMRDLAKKYGSVYTLPMGNKSILVLNDWASTKEALVDNAEAFSGRPQNALYDSTLNYTDITFTSGKPWRERRRFTLQHLRDLGFGKKSMEETIMVEVEKILARLKSNPVANISAFFYFSFVNIIWSLVGDKTFKSSNDAYMIEFNNATNILFKELTNTNLINFIPMLKYLPGISLHNTVKANNRLFKFFDTEIEEHIKTYQNGHLRDIIDVFLQGIFKHEESKSDTNIFTKKVLRGVMWNLFNAGTDTGATTLSWALLYMITWPEIQRKVQAELDEVIGTVRLPSYSDRPHLPYTEAVILEIQRYATIVPLSVLHSTIEKTTFRNYVLPKDTIVMQNIWAVHFDPDLWGDPEVFRPERFLDENGRVIKPKYFIPFSVGSRVCLGEALAKMEVFLFFTSLMHKYSFSLPVGICPPIFDPVIAITVAPHPFDFVAKLRHQDVN